MQRAHGSFGEHAAVPPQPATAAATRHAYHFSNPPTPHDWARIQEHVYQYYVLQNQPLHSVRQLLLKDHGFKASERMIKARLSKWNYIKNAKREDWGYLAILHETRRRENKSTVFEIRGHRKTPRDLQRFVRNQNISPEDFLAESFKKVREKGNPFPDYIRAFTPDPEEILYSPSADTSLSEVRSPSPLLTDPAKGTPLERSASLGASVGICANSDDVLYYRNPERQDRDRFDHICPYESYANGADCLSHVGVAHADMSSARPTSRHGRHLYSCERMRLELEACSTQLLKPIPLMSRYGHTDMRCWTLINHPTHSPNSKTKTTAVYDFTEHETCSRCNQPSSIHFPSLDLFEPRQLQRNILNDAVDHTLQVPTSTRDEGSWVWVSWCFLACICLTRGDYEVAQQVLNQAATKFETLLRTRDPLLLTAAGLMITILHLHDQNEISARILQCAKDVADRVLADGDPVRATVAYLTASAKVKDEALKDPAHSSTRLGVIYSRIKSMYPRGHPYVIAAQHNYAWMLKYDNKLQDAEIQALEVYRAAKEHFGNMHMQTITSRSILAGCLALQVGREHDCIATYREIIHDATQILGVIHPYTLEAQRRLAETMLNIGQVDLALKLHRTIYFGKATMLGKGHEFTEGQWRHYLTLLKKHGRWEDDKGQPSAERREFESLFRKEPEEAWEVISRQDAEEDTEMTDGPSSAMFSAASKQEHEWCRLAIAKSMTRSRSTSPTGSNEYEAY